MYILLGVVGLIWVLISRMLSSANLSPLCRHRSRNVTSSVENSAVKLMHGCRSLMILMNCSRLSFVSVHTKNISSMYLFQCVGEWFVSVRILDSSFPMKMLARQVPSLYPWLYPVSGCRIDC